MTNEFWGKCADSSCVVVPVKVYSKYNESGNLSESDFVGIKYTALFIDNEIVAPDYWIMVDNMQDGLQNYFETPEDALANFCA